MKFPSIFLFAISAAMNLSLGNTKVHVGMPVFEYGQGYEIGINKTFLELGFIEFEAGVKASFITDEYRVLLQKGGPTDIVYSEKQRLFYASVPLDILIIYKSEYFSPFLKFQNQVDALVYKNAIRTENEDLYRNRMRESRFMFRSGGCTGTIFKIMNQQFQADIAYY